MNKLDKQYQALLQDILDNGVTKSDRTGTGTLSVFGRQIRHKMSEGFPLLTTKKMSFRLVATELLWFLRGDTNIKYLVDNGCNIWNGDCFTNYSKNVWRHTNLELLTQEEFIDRIKTDDKFANVWGDLGPIYGKQWRKWTNYTGDEINEGTYEMTNEPIDQIANLINELKTNPDSRRLMVNAWNVADLDSCVIPPCHYGFQVYTRELSLEERRSLVSQEVFNKIYNGGGPDTLSHSEINQFNVPIRSISLMFNMRSTDVPLGLPFNIASYALLLEIIGRMVNMVTYELIANLGDVHIYKNQIDGVKEQLTRTSMKLPNLIISDEVNFNGNIYEFLESCNKDIFKLDGYESHPSIKIPLSN